MSGQMKKKYFEGHAVDGGKTVEKKLFTLKNETDAMKDGKGNH